MEKRTRKDEYNESILDLRTKVMIDDKEEIAMKPYYYYRNGFLHIRYMVDRCVSLTESEKTKLKLDLTTSYNKQEVLSKMWNFLTTCVKREVIRDGISELEKRINRYKNDRHKD